MRLVVYLLSIILLTACGAPPASGGDEAGARDTLGTARYLHISAQRDYTRVTLLDPWHAGRTLQTLLLCDRDKPLPKVLPQGTVIRVPLQRAAILSGVHAAAISELGAGRAVVGLCDADYLCTPALRQAVAQGRWTDFGSSMRPNVERMVQAKVDAVLLSPFENAGYGALETFRAPLIPLADYMETTPLGRAAWIRLLGLLFGKEEQANQLFRATAHAYDSLRKAASRAGSRPTLLVDQMAGGTWYVPAGDSYLGAMYADAALVYPFSSHSGGGSVTRTFESVYAAAQGADFWLIKYGAESPLTYTALGAAYPPYRTLRPFARRRVYGCNTLCVPYYEEVPFHPDRLLRDLIYIAHPRILPNHRLRYYHPLAP